MLAGVVAALLALPGCGGDDGPASSTATATATTETEHSSTQAVQTQTDNQPAQTETESPTDTGPEAMPGGAGDEEPARTLALLTAREGRITPRVVRVPPFISVKVELRSADGASYALRFGDTTITAGGQLRSVSTTLAGLRPNEAIVGIPQGIGNRVRIEATAEPGP